MIERLEVADTREPRAVPRFQAHPMPAAMVGIGMIGLAWLALGACQRASARGSLARVRSQGMTGTGDELNDESLFLPFDYPWTGESAGGYTPGLADDGGDPLEGLLRSDRRGFRFRVEDSLHAAQRLIRQGSWHARYRFHRWLETNPLLVGAAAAVIGGVVSTVLTHSDSSDRRLSSTPRRRAG
jgi:hypothetical protein